MKEPVMPQTKQNPRRAERLRPEAVRYRFTPRTFATIEIVTTIKILVRKKNPHLRNIYKLQIKIFAETL